MVCLKSKFYDEDNLAATLLTDMELPLKEGGGFNLAPLPEFLTSGRVGTLETDRSTMYKNVWSHFPRDQLN